MKNQKEQIRNILITAGILGAAWLICFGLSKLYDDNNPFASSLFILAVALIARFTDRYLYGILASVISLFCVNYFFTYPFMTLDFGISGYPLTFICMLLVSFLVSTLTTRLRQQERIRSEMERERMRSNLLRSISHDLRTPLTAILGASSALMNERSMAEDEQRGLLSEIHRDAEWLIRVTENLLTITRISGGETEIRKEMEAVEEVVGSAIVKFRRKYPGMTVRSEYPDGILMAPMDATLMEQVFLNLFENAALHGKKADRILVRSWQEGERAWISVTDNGEGLPNGFGTETDSGIGWTDRNQNVKRNMGIGLSVCRTILHAHGGEIRIGNLETGGAEAVLWLPEGEIEDE